MIINQIAGNTATHHLEGLTIDPLELEWYETTKRIQRKITVGGMEIAIRFLKEGQRLLQNDILYLDEHKAVVVHIKPCEAIVVSPQTMLEMGTICYEIGNKHLHLFIQEDQVLIPYEEPLFRWLRASGFNPAKEERQLLNMLQSNATPHGHGGTSLFTKIITLASKHGG
ncbi:MAG: urease accessory protein UreE [Ginsengibacter sp.]